MLIEKLVSEEYRKRLWVGVERRRVYLIKEGVSLADLHERNPGKLIERIEELPSMADGRVGTTRAGARWTGWRGGPRRTWRS